MKTFMAMLIIMIVGLTTAGAAPAASTWTTSGIASDLYDQNFNYPISRFTPHSGVRFQLGYNMASINKQLSENWWVTAGYQGGPLQFSVINLGAAYSILPNVAVSIGYILETKYNLQNAIFRTQLDIKF